MSKAQIGLVAIISTILTLALIGGSLLMFTQVSAAPSETILAQTTGSAGYLSVSALAFWAGEPVCGLL
ncbi:MAG: hypothetical protein HC875_17235 [Anaerolineales bacterium]|nr:hypothetical protein [Anaerolineales bacterium]